MQRTRDPHSPPPAARLRLPGAAACAGLLLLTGLVLGPAVWDAGLLNFDDNLFFGPDNPTFRAAWEEGDLAPLVDPRHTIANAYLPVSHLSLFADYALQRALGVGPRPAHLHSLLLHALAAFVLARLLGRLGLRALPATLAAAVFAVHPALVESVAWVSGRKDVLSGLLVFAALAAVARASRGGRRADVAAAPVCAVLALYAKGTAVVLVGLAPCVVLLVDRRSRRGWAAAAAVAVVAVLAGVHHAAIAAAEGTMQAGEAGIGLARVPGAFLHYLATVVWPAEPNVLHPEQKTLAAFGERLLPGLLALVAVAAAAVWSWRRGRTRVAAGMAMAVLAWLPFNTAWPASSIAAADRYLYLVLPGVVLALAAAPGGAVVLALALVPLGWGAADRARDFESSEALWESSLAADPENAVARINLALAVLPRDPDRARELAAAAVEDARHPVHRLRAERLLRDLALQRGLLEEACRHALRAGEIADALPPQAGLGDARLQAHLTAAVLLRAAGRDEQARAAADRARRAAPGHPSVLAFEAETLRLQAAGPEGTVDADAPAARRAQRLLERALAADPEHFDALLSRARWHRATGELLAALKLFRRAREVDEGRAETWLGEVDLYLESGEYAGAEEAARAGIAAGVQDPNLLLRLGLALAGQGRLEAAREYYDRYLQVRPHDDAVRRALAAVLAAETVQGLYQRRPEELEDAAERIRALDPHNAEAWLILGLAKRLRRDLAAAAVLLEKAHEAMPESEDALRLLAENERDLGYQELREGDVEAALDHFRRFVALDAPGVGTESAESILRVHWRRHEERGEEAFVAGDAAAAEASFRRCLELVPEQTSACFQLGLAILRQDDGREEEALALFERAAAGQREHGLDASMPVLYQVLTLQRLGRDDEARARAEDFLANARLMQPSVAERIRAAIE